RAPLRPRRPLRRRDRAEQQRIVGADPVRDCRCRKDITDRVRSYKGCRLANRIATTDGGHERRSQAPFGKGGAAKRRGFGRQRPGAQGFASPCDAKPWGFSALRAEKRRSRPISRVLSWTVIPLGASSPIRSSSLPGDSAGRVIV